MINNMKYIIKNLPIPDKPQHLNNTSNHSIYK